MLTLDIRNLIVLGEFGLIVGHHSLKVGRACNPLPVELKPKLVTVRERASSFRKIPRKLKHLPVFRKFNPEMPPNPKVHDIPPIKCPSRNHMASRR